MENNLETTESPANKNKTLSVSSTDSLCSSSNDLNYDIKTNKTDESKNKSVDEEENSEENFDFSKTGAKPKRKNLINNNNKSSLSSSTSSSLSSLSIISQFSSNAPITTSSSSSSSSSASSYSSSSAKKKPSSNPKSNKSKSSNWTLLDNDDDDSDNKTASVLSRNDFNEITTCPLCCKIVKGDLQRHFVSEHREFECPFCGLLFDNDFVLNQHVNTVHSDDANNQLVDKKETMNNVKEINTSVVDVMTIGSSKIDTAKENLVCPVCNLVINEGLAFLELHVELHFNSEINETIGASAILPPQPSPQTDDLMHFVQTNKLTQARSRTQSVSSLTANVDENFEIDQVMTFTDCDMNEANVNNAAKLNDEDFFYANERMNYSMNENEASEPHADLERNDYELALRLDREEKERFTRNTSENLSLNLKDNTNKSSLLFKNNLLNVNSSDYLTAQLLERQEKESLKYKLCKENAFDEDCAAELSADCQSDSEYAAELEHEWLKQKYGMTNVKATSKAIANLDRALKMNNIDLVTYHYERDQIEAKVNAVVDDSITCTRGLIEMIQSIPLNKNTTKRYLCTSCDHYSSGFIDRGFGCGYRNTQMLLSSIREDPAIRDVMFNNNNRQMPSITKIQQLIENAWSKSFDLLGREQLGGTVKNTAKWIGASDICALFSSLRIRTELIDIQSVSANSVTSILFKFVKNYFEEESKSGNPIHPIYLQHDGHSRTIVGIETGKFDSLLLFDPGSRRAQIEQFKLNKAKSMHVFRRGLNAFKKREYQLLLVKGVMQSDEEYERAKVLKSKKLTS